MQLKRTRQEQILPLANTNRYNLTVIGVGAVGSSTSFLLSKMGINNIVLFDDDMVEEHNIPNQYFRVEDIGKPKVEALKQIIAQYTDSIVTPNNKKYEGEPLSGIVVSSVDSMTSRHAIWGEIKKQGMSVPWYIDSRMGAEVAEIYVIRPNKDGRAYEEYLWAQEEAVNLPCTARAIIYTGMGLASSICAIVKNILNGEETPERRLIDFRCGRILDMEL